MAEIMLGVEVAKAMKTQIIEKVEGWKEKGLFPISPLSVWAQERMTWLMSAVPKKNGTYRD